MKRTLVQVALLVRDYDEAIAYYTAVLGFHLLEDSPLSPVKRWVVVSPSRDGTFCRILLAKAADETQRAAIGKQSGGRVFLFLHTDDFDRDYAGYQARGVVFVRPPAVETYGKVAVFRDRYGNLWDLIQPAG